MFPVPLHQPCCPSYIPRLPHCVVNYSHEILRMPLLTIGTHLDEHRMNSRWKDLLVVPKSLLYVLNIPLDLLCLITNAPHHHQLNDELLSISPYPFLAGLDYASPIAGIPMELVHLLLGSLPPSGTSLPTLLYDDLSCSDILLISMYTSLCNDYSECSTREPSSRSLSYGSQCGRGGFGVVSVSSRRDKRMQYVHGTH